MLMLTLALTWMLWPLGRGAGGACTLDDIQAIQPDANFPLEKIDGQWYVNQVYGDSAASGYTSYTLDVIPTPTGLALYSNVQVGNEECAHTVLEFSATELRYVFTKGDAAQTIGGLVVAAADGEGQRALLYWCGSSELRGAPRPCPQPVTLLLGRTADPAPAGTWLTSLTSSSSSSSASSSSLPCHDNAQGLTVSQGEKCPLKQMIEPSGRDCLVANFPVQPNFDLNEYVSRPWKEMAWLAPMYIPPSEFFQDYLHTYTLRPDGSVLCDVEARNPQKNNTCMFYQLNLTVTATPGKLLLYDRDDEDPAPYNVIHVDYDRYALVFGCVTEDAASGRCQTGRGWVWSRDVTLARRYRLQANALIMDLCVNPAAWFPTTHLRPCSDGTGGADSGSRFPFAAVLMGVFLCTASSLFN